MAAIYKIGESYSHQANDLEVVLTCRYCSILSLIATYTPEDHLLSNCNNGFAFGGFTALTFSVHFSVMGTSSWPLGP